MKLATFTHEGHTRLGVVHADDPQDLATAEVADLGGASGVPGDMSALIEAGKAGLDAVAAAAKGAPRRALSEVTLEAPIAKPGKILAIGLNYADHIEETGRDTPEHQIWFNKQRTCAHGPYADVAMPSVSHYLDYEAEMVMVIGRRAKHVPRDRAHEVVFGYACGNDVSVRDWQLATPTMTMGKSFDTHGPFGPWITTTDEVGDPHDIGFTCHVNGERMQSSNTRHMVFDCWAQIEHLTKAFTLEPGDLIFTGTSGGVGVVKKPPEFRAVGDVMRMSFDGLGYIENRVAKEDASTVIA